jgi:hypothetical protein
MATRYIIAALLAAGLPASAHAGVLISEVAWMGSSDDANAEWIELYNDGPAVDLSGWSLAATDGQPAIDLTGTLAANSYALLERTDDSTVPGISAFLIYTGAMGNTGEVLELRDQSGLLVDVVDGSGGWAIGGDNSSKYTLQRVGEPAVGSWSTAPATPAGSEPVGDATLDEAAADDNTSSVTQKTTPKVPSGGSILYGVPDEDDVLMREPALTLDVGTDRTQTAGVPSMFLARAYKENAQETVVDDVTWNFGDGAVREGREVQHAYQYPGEYIVTVTGRRDTFRKEVQDTARFVVTVVEPAVTIAHVSNTYVELVNGSSDEVDLSGCALVSGTSHFRIPEGTYVLPGATLKLPASVTGYKPGSSARLFNPDGVLLASNVPTPPAPVVRTRVATPAAKPTVPTSIQEPTVVEAPVSIGPEPVLAAETLAAAVARADDTSESSLWWWLAALAAVIGTAITSVVLMRREQAEVIAGYVIEDDSNLDSPNRV